MYQRAIACFRRQRQQCVQFIKLSSRAERRNDHNWMRRGSHFQQVCFYTHTHTRKKTRRVKPDSPGMPGGVFRYFPLKCWITTSHFSVDSILQQHKERNWMEDIHCRLELRFLVQGQSEREPWSADEKSPTKEPCLSVAADTWSQVPFVGCSSTTAAAAFRKFSSSYPVIIRPNPAE